jgi:acyl dehydratase
MMTAPSTVQSTTQPLEFEDFNVGQFFESEPYEVTREDSMKFAAEFDPQPFHLDPKAAEATFFKGLAASGWYTAAIAMRLRVQTIEVKGGMIGAGIEEIRWTKPVRPGDVLRLREDVVGMRTLSSRPDYGLVRMDSTMTNQLGEVVMTMKVSALAPRRAVTMA